MRSSLKYAVAASGLVASVANAITLDVSSDDSIKSAAGTIAASLTSWYKGNTDASQVGVLPPPYYWWEGGAMWGALVDYWYYTGDDTYNAITTQALLSQVGPDFDYMVPAHVKDEGNDDQAFWGFTTMNAAERGYASPPSDIPSWVDLTINIWNTQAARWDVSTCEGGLRWQIFSFNNGYTYKNSVSNGAFIQLAARLGRYTGNQTYFDWVEKVWEWESSVGLIDSGYAIYDGTDVTENCSSVNHIQWTYSLGIHLYAAAVMYNVTEGSSIWQERINGLLAASSVFFSPDGYPNANNVMFESACETINTCDTDQYSFKGYLARFMYKTTEMAPFTAPAIFTLMEASAEAAAASCSGGEDGSTCGEVWYTGSYDGNYGVGQSMSAMEVIQGLLVRNSGPPYTKADVHIDVNTSSVSPAPVPTVTTAPVLQTTAAQTATATPKPSKKKNDAGHSTANLGLAMASAIIVGGTLMLQSSGSSSSTSEAAATTSENPNELDTVKMPEVTTSIQDNTSDTVSGTFSPISTSTFVMPTLYPLPDEPHNETSEDLVDTGMKPENDADGTKNDNNNDIATPIASAVIDASSNASSPRKKSDAGEASVGATKLAFIAALAGTLGVL